jgi:membrane protein implicated in regulation of membrane protease activity
MEDKEARAFKVVIAIIGMAVMLLVFGVTPLVAHQLGVASVTGFDTAFSFTFIGFGIFTLILSGVLFFLSRYEMRRRRERDYLKEEREESWLRPRGRL